MAPENIFVSEAQGQYPIYVKFTAMQKITVTYKNKTFGIVKETIVAGFDAVRYRECLNNMFEGENKDMGEQHIRTPVNTCISVL